MRIAFIGLGNMGAPMAANLVRDGHRVLGYDPIAPAPDGVTMAASVAAAATGAEVAVTMLPDGPILLQVAAELIPALPRGAAFCDCSTVDVETARAVADRAAAAGLDWLDAPVSGGTAGADAGTLTFMAGGSEAAFSRLRPLLSAMGRRVVHCGGPGNGQAAKLCNNMILGVTMIATCEAFVLADRLGLSRSAMFEVVSNSSGQNWSLNSYCPAPGVGPKTPADNGYRPGFASELMLKDLALSQMAATQADADTPMGALARELYRRFVEDEDGRGSDFSAMLPRFESRRRGRDAASGLSPEPAAGPPPDRRGPPARRRRAPGRA